MCAVLEMFWVLVVTLSLVSCSVSPRRRNAIPSTDFCPSGFCSPLIVLVVRLYSVIVNSLSVANYCTLLHRENGSFEVLSLKNLLTPAGLRSRSSNISAMCSDAANHGSFRHNVSRHIREKKQCVDKRVPLHDAQRRAHHVTMVDAQASADRTENRKTH